MSVVYTFCVFLHFVHLIGAFDIRCMHEKDVVAQLEHQNLEILVYSKHNYQGGHKKTNWENKFKFYDTLLYKKIRHITSNPNKVTPI